jgi:hypothetical protein
MDESPGRPALLNAEKMAGTTHCSLLQRADTGLCFIHPDKYFSIYSFKNAHLHSQTCSRACCSRPLPTQSPGK